MTTEKQSSKKSKLEECIEDVFGPMRAATKEEQDSVRRYIDSISTIEYTNIFKPAD